MTAPPRPGGGAGQRTGNKKSGGGRKQNKAAGIAPADKPPQSKAPSKHEPQESKRSIDDISWEEVLCAVRRVFADGAVRDRETAIREVARELGFERVGPNIRTDMETALNTASKRYIIETHDGLSRRCTGSIDDYHREFLKKTLLGVMGAVWWERDQAIHAAARSLGFARTGPKIRQAFKSALTGLIRQGQVETGNDGFIRRT